MARLLAIAVAVPVGSALALWVLNVIVGYVYFASGTPSEGLRKALLLGGITVGGVAGAVAVDLAMSQQRSRLRPVARVIVSAAAVVLLLGLIWHGATVPLLVVAVIIGLVLVLNGGIGEPPRQAP